MEAWEYIKAASEGVIVQECVDGEWSETEIGQWAVAGIERAIILGTIRIKPKMKTITFMYKPDSSLDSKYISCIAENNHVAPGSRWEKGPIIEVPYVID